MSVSEVGKVINTEDHKEPRIKIYGAWSLEELQVVANITDHGAETLEAHELQY